MRPLEQQRQLRPAARVLQQANRGLQQDELVGMGPVGGQPGLEGLLIGLCAQGRAQARVPLRSGRQLAGAGAGRGSRSRHGRPLKTFIRCSLALAIWSSTVSMAMPRGPADLGVGLLLHVIEQEHRLGSLRHHFHG